MLHANKLFVVLLLTGLLTACKKEVDPVIVIPPSSGSQVELSGLAGSETGANAANAVWVDLSADKPTSVARAAWDLGFYSGGDFRVIINNTTAAAAKVLGKNDLAQVGTADTVGVTLAFSQAAPSAAEFGLIDDVSGDLSKTLIPAVSSTEADNKVIILNRGIGGGVAARAWKKLRILRAGSGYTLQYANITDAAYKTVSISKDAAYNFRFVSLDEGAVVNVEPRKDSWDLVWTYSMYKTAFGAGDVPYAFSDLVFINKLAGVQAAEVLTSTVSYDSFAWTNLTGLSFSSDRDVIGSKWRATTGTVGVKTDRFYVLKDAAGNVYKLKFLSFTSQDGGTRGKPVIRYELVKK
ncbi:MAG: HmuY family protein [Williamsia sp.]|nr:HmuY family protein [Williamsia sp.]